LQGKGVQGAEVIGRFVINTTIGAGGFLDPASALGLGPQTEDFGQTLGVWGVGPGPYLVLPLLGPSTLRDAPALGVDAATAILPFFIDGWILVGARVVDVVNTRAQFLQEVADAKAASLDYYVFVRNAYLQRRQALIEDRGKKGIPESVQIYEEQDLYTVPCPSPRSACDRVRVPPGRRGCARRRPGIASRRRAEHLRQGARHPRRQGPVEGGPPR